MAEQSIRNLSELYSNTLATEAKLATQAFRAVATQITQDADYTGISPACALWTQAVNCDEISHVINHLEIGTIQDAIHNMNESSFDMTIYTQFIQRLCDLKDECLLNHPERAVGDPNPDPLKPRQQVAKETRFQLHKDRCPYLDHQPNDKHRALEKEYKLEYNRGDVEPTEYQADVLQSAFLVHQEPVPVRNRALERLSKFNRYHLPESETREFEALKKSFEAIGHIIKKDKNNPMEGNPAPNQFFHWALHNNMDCSMRLTASHGYDMIETWSRNQAAQAEQDWDEDSIDIPANRQKKSSFTDADNKILSHNTPAARALARINCSFYTSMQMWSTVFNVFQRGDRCDVTTGQHGLICSRAQRSHAMYGQKPEQARVILQSNLLSLDCQNDQRLCLILAGLGQRVSNYAKIAKDRCFAFYCGMMEEEQVASSPHTNPGQYIWKIGGTRGPRVPGLSSGIDKKLDTQCCKCVFTTHTRDEGIKIIMTWHWFLNMSSDDRKRTITRLLDELNDKENAVSQNTLGVDATLRKPRKNNANRKSKCDLIEIKEDEKAEGAAPKFFTKHSFRTTYVNYHRIQWEALKSKIATMEKSNKRLEINNKSIEVSNEKLRMRIASYKEHQDLFDKKLKELKAAEKTKKGKKRTLKQLRDSINSENKVFSKLIKDKPSTEELEAEMQVPAVPPIIPEIRSATEFREAINSNQGWASGSDKTYEKYSKPWRSIKSHITCLDNFSIGVTDGFECTTHYYAEYSVFNYKGLWMRTFPDIAAYSPAIPSDWNKVFHARMHEVSTDKSCLVVISTNEHWINYTRAYNIDDDGNDIIGSYDLEKIDVNDVRTFNNMNAIMDSRFSLSPITTPTGFEIIIQLIFNQRMGSFCVHDQDGPGHSVGDVVQVDEAPVVGHRLLQA